MDWASLSHAYGAADDVPGLLAALSSATAAHRADARYWLRATLCHQGTRYPASAAAIPALVAIAVRTEEPERGWALDLLADLAVGDADRWLLRGGDPQAGEPAVDAVLGALTQELPALRALLTDPSPAIRARAGRVLVVLGLGHELPPDPDGVVRVGLALGSRAPKLFLGDPEPWVAAAAAYRAHDVPTAARLATNLPPASACPWLGGDSLPLILATLVAGAPAPDAASALSRLAHAASPATARAAFPLAVAAAHPRLPPRGGWPDLATTPPPLAALARLVAQSHALGTPDAWEALQRAGLPGSPDALGTFLRLPRSRSVLDAAWDGAETWRTLGNALGSGAGGPTIVRELEGATVSTTLGAPRRPHGDRARVVRKLAGLGAAAVPVLLAYAEEDERPLEALAPAFESVVGADPAGVRDVVVALARERATPVVRWDRRGTVTHHAGQVVLLGLGARAAAALGQLPDPALEPLTDGALAAEVFAGELSRWLDVVDDRTRQRWAAARLEARPQDLRGPVLQRALEALDDAEVSAALARLDPALAVDALPPRRLAALGPALLARIEQFLAERHRWMRDRLGEEVDRLASALRAKGPGAVRALRKLPAGARTSSLLAGAGPTPVTKQGATSPMVAQARPDAAEALARAVVELVLAEPLLGWVLGRVERSFTEITPSMGWSIRPGRRITLLVNAEWFVGLAGRVRVGALRHEVLHLLFGHPFRTDLAHVELACWGTAADLVVNEHPGRWPLPADARRHPWGAPPVPEPVVLDEAYQLLLAQRFAANAPSGGVWHSDHRFWREPPGGGALAPGELADAGAGFDAVVNEGVEALGGDAVWGLDPGVRGLVLGAVERHRATLDWRRLLRAFAAGSRRTEVHHTLKRRSRRYGTFPGLRIRRHHRLAVAVDTSGSVSADTLAVFFHEIGALHRSGSEVVVVECDARVQRAWRFTGATPEEVHGRGGTAFEPVMRWLRGADAERFDALVYLTDGVGPAPETRPPCPMLWVLTPEAEPGPHLRFGGVVKIPPRL
jgi:hypothetical protein